MGKDVQKPGEVYKRLRLAIGQKNKVRGIEIQERKAEGKIFQYADDTTVIVEGKESVKHVMEIIKEYCKGSGSKFNENKTVSKTTSKQRFGKALILRDSFNFKEVDEMKILRILIGKNKKKVRDEMWEELLTRVERRLNFWKQRALNLKGKVLILNVLMVSKLW
ncbi:MAG: reverse transcriptase domain-containing protein [Cetobacterium sp.]